MKYFLTKLFRTRKFLNGRKNYISIIRGETSANSHELRLNFDSLQKGLLNWSIFGRFYINHMFETFKELEFKRKQTPVLPPLQSGLTGIKSLNPSEGDFSNLSTNHFVHQLQTAEDNEEFHLSEVLTEYSSYETESMIFGKSNSQASYT